MKHLLLTTISAVLVVGCGESPNGLLEEAAKRGNISIHDAAVFGNIEAVKKHLAAGTDVNAKDKKKVTPLHHAAYGHKEIVELLIAKGADVNAKTNVRRTPLHFAAMEGHKEIAELLIAKAKDGSKASSEA